MGYEQTATSKKRLVGLLIALVFHALLIYALVSGLARDFVKKAQKTLDVTIIQEVKLPPPPPPPPPSPPKEVPQQQVVERPKAYVPPVEVAVDVAVAELDAISSVTTDAPPPPKMEVAPVAPAPQPQPKVRTKPVLAGGCKPPKYPDESIEMEEEGTVVLSFQVDVSGQVAASKLVKSSGFNRLDEAAKAAFEICRFTPGMVDDVPEVSWVQQSFEWKLQ